jgi:AraC-like DNA-binding protein
MIEPASTVPLHAAVSVYDAGQREPLHVHEHEGQLKWPRAVAAVRVPGGLFVVPVDCAVWIPPGALHGGIYSEPVREHSLFVPAAACAALPTESSMVSVTAPLQALLLAQPASLEGDALRTAVDVLRAEMKDTGHRPLALTLPPSSSVLPLVESLLQNPTDERSLEVWASLLGISVSTLSRTFQRETGRSFGSWRTHVRVLHALRALARGTSVAAVAESLGYRPSAFVQTFRKTLGVTPGKYYSVGGAP